MIASPWYKISRNPSSTAHTSHSDPLLPPLSQRPPSCPLRMAAAQGPATSPPLPTLPLRTAAQASQADAGLCAQQRRPNECVAPAPPAGAEASASASCSSWPDLCSPAFRSPTSRAGLRWRRISSLQICSRTRRRSRLSPPMHPAPSARSAAVVHPGLGSQQIHPPPRSPCQSSSSSSRFNL